MNMHMPFSALHVPPVWQPVGVHVPGVNEHMPLAVLHVPPV
jgi:hypothetical protein